MIIYPIMYLVSGTMITVIRIKDLKEDQAQRKKHSCQDDMCFYPGNFLVSLLLWPLLLLFLLARAGLRSVRGKQTVCGISRRRWQRRTITTQDVERGSTEGIELQQPWGAAEGVRGEETAQHGEASSGPSPRDATAQADLATDKAPPPAYS